MLCLTAEKTVTFDTHTPWQVRSGLAVLHIGGVSLPIALGLWLMMWPVLTKVCATGGHPPDTSCLARMHAFRDGSCVSRRHPR
jgi:hypothetical protein